MNMLRQALDLWKKEKQNRGTTLQRRLILFFASATMTLILSFALLLMLFGITGRGEKAARDYLSNELSHAASAVSDDFGRFSLLGLNLSSSISKSSDSFFEENRISAGELPGHPELLEGLLAEEMPFLLNTMDTQACSGIFILLDATINPASGTAATSRSGIFIRKTQPLSVPSVGAKNYYLRGPANVARDHGIELLGQWKMEYDITGEEFFSSVMETARENEALPLSRLYYWSGRVTLHGNSEAGFLLCVPLRSADGTVFGICGVEISDRMFKQLYSPKESDYENVFAAFAPSDDAVLETSRGLIAGNYYLTGHRMTEDLSLLNHKNSFTCFSGSSAMYGGLCESIRLYPAGSPYEDEQWSVAVLMPKELLDDAVKGNFAYLILITILLLVASLTISVVISRRYLQPLTKAFDSIRNSSYNGETQMPYLEIKDLFVFLEDKDHEHEEALHQLGERLKGAKSEYEEAQTQLSRLSDRKHQEIDRDCYELFLTRLKTLTAREREVFQLYLDGKSAREIVVLLEFSENALKYHNKNIYSKLGVSSRKELLMYAALMKQDEKKA